MNNDETHHCQTQDLRAETIVLAPRRAALFLKENLHVLVNILEANSYADQVSFRPGFLKDTLGNCHVVSECIFLSCSFTIKHSCVKALEVALGPSLSLLIDGEPHFNANGSRTLESLVNDELACVQLCATENSGTLEESPIGVGPVSWPRFSRTCVLEANANIGEFTFSSYGALLFKGDKGNSILPLLQGMPFAPSLSSGPWISCQVDDLQLWSNIKGVVPQGPCRSRLRGGCPIITISLPSWNWVSRDRNPPFILVWNPSTNAVEEVIRDSMPYRIELIPFIYRKTNMDILRTGCSRDGQEWIYRPTSVLENLEIDQHRVRLSKQYMPWVIFAHQEKPSRLETALADALSVRVLIDWTLDSHGQLRKGIPSRARKLEVVTFIQVVFFAVKLSALPTCRCDDSVYNLPQSLSSASISTLSHDGPEDFLNCDVDHGYLYVKKQKTYTDSVSFEAVVVQLRPQHGILRRSATRLFTLTTPDFFISGIALNCIYKIVKDYVSHRKPD